MWIIFTPIGIIAFALYVTIVIMKLDTTEAIILGIFSVLATGIFFAYATPLSIPIITATQIIITIMDTAM